MTGARTEEHGTRIELAYELEETPQKVWRAISLREYRESWLPAGALADPEPAAVTPGEDIRFRMRDGSPPYLESAVTFRISPNASGGTTLQVIHELTDVRFAPPAGDAANDDASLMLAA